LVLSRAWQALLWSALVFPGSGHFQLKHAWRGALLAGLTTLCLALLTIQYSLHIQQALLAATDANGLTDFRQLLHLTWRACVDDPWMAYALWAMLALWLIAMLDAFRLGKQLERQHAS